MLRASRVRTRSALRIIAILLALLGLLVLPGCWVQSINGLSEAELLGTDKDQVYDPGLLGAWTSTNSDGCVTTLDVTAESKDYHWKVINVGKGCNNENDEAETDYYEGQLFQLGDHKFLDLTARASDICNACVAVHWIFKVETETDSLNLIPIDSDWLKKAEKEKTVTLATSYGDRDTLTASPKELKEFCRKYADDENVFKSEPDSTLVRKQP